MSLAVLRRFEAIRTGILLVTLTLLEASSGVCVQLSQHPGTAGFPLLQGRGVRPIEKKSAEDFDPSDSAGLFVGVRDFDDKSEFPEVPFAVDDAVDLAHLFSLELGLVDPSRAILLLSGEPVKETSQQSLAKLIASGARRLEADRSVILAQLDAQSDRVGPKGLLVITFASHGKRGQGLDYVLATDSFARVLDETSVSSQHLFARLDKAKATRKIVLLDICRRVLRGRDSSPDPSFTLSPELARRIAESKGNVILLAAPMDGVAWDDHDRKNGVFTAAVLDALHCQATSDAKGFVTAGALADFVEEQVIAWVENNRPGDEPEGIERQVSGPAAKMTLARCDVPPPDCGQVKIEAVQIHTGQGGIRRLVPPQDRLSLAAQEVEALENLAVQAVLSGPPAALKQCVCRWEKRNESTADWEPLEATGEGCSLSVEPPEPFSNVILRLTVGKSTLPITIDLQ